jgi:glycerol kinase
VGVTKSVRRGPPNQHHTFTPLPAYSAGLAVGFFKDTEELRARWVVDQTWTPVIEEAKRDELYGFWKKAVTRSFDWVDY